MNRFFTGVRAGYTHTTWWTAVAHRPHPTLPTPPRRDQPLEVTKPPWQKLPTAPSRCELSPRGHVSRQAGRHAGKIRFRRPRACIYVYVYIDGDVQAGHTRRERFDNSDILCYFILFYFIYSFMFHSQCSKKKSPSFSLLSYTRYQVPGICIPGTRNSDAGSQSRPFFSRSSAPTVSCLGFLSRQDFGLAFSSLVASRRNAPTHATYYWGALSSLYQFFFSICLQIISKVRPTRDSYSRTDSKYCC